MEYGLVFNWDKLESMPVRCENIIRKADGTLVKTKSSMVYLGSLLSNDGRIGSELARRLGMSRGDFQKLRRVWSHSNLTRRRKTEIFNACIISKLMYCLHTAYLNKAERRKLDGLQARCMRQIIGVLPSFISRVSNADVLGKANAATLSSTLLKQQLHLFGTIARRPAGDAVRDLIFEHGTLDLRISAFQRRRGRPRTSWAKYVWDQAVLAAGSRDNLHGILQDTILARKAWGKAVTQHCK